MVGDGSHLFRNGTAFFFSANDAISVLENIGQIGIKMPSFLRKALINLKDTYDSSPSQSKKNDNEKWIHLSSYSLITVSYTHLDVYKRQVSSYKKYKASGWSRALFAEHESEVRRYKQALLTFDEAGYQTVPKRKALYDALGQLKSQRQELIGEYAAAKKTKQELLTVQANLNALLPQDKKERTHSDTERS